MNIDLSLLTALRRAGSEAVSGAELAQNLGITRAAIWARVEALRALGYEITASPHGGYRLIRAPDRLHADDLLSRLGPTRVVGRTLQVFQKTTSTNDVIERMARDGVPEGAVVFAESQTRGRGRLGRGWSSPPGQGLWFSVLLRPELRPLEATQLTVAAATASARAIRDFTGLPVGVKWPNDLLLRNHKVAGILTELSAEPDRIRYLVLGIGVNVNQGASDFPADLRPRAISLRQALSASAPGGERRRRAAVAGGERPAAARPLDRSALAVLLLRELDRDYARILSGRFEAVAEEWAAFCTTLGRAVTIAIGPRLVRGRAESLDRDGALLVRTEHGLLERISGGDVRMDT
ncbi:MAG TPA: biotin--[acetyl-CoA-carboxylase] ligase [Verrucomicrobiota bacterium]|nr:biotin--[acetyl-CoA-carboxylase] ligase [Verrucomicrobiota bacterium]HNU50524.1 biotin--[acetyl-CoA-carboxylase] ligase [Verrucomicrobiota bacterium]